MYSGYYEWRTEKSCLEIESELIGSIFYECSVMENPSHAVAAKACIRAMPMCGPQFKMSCRASRDVKWQVHYCMSLALTTMRLDSGAASAARGRQP